MRGRLHWDAARRCQKQGRYRENGNRQGSDYLVQQGLQVQTLIPGVVREVCHERDYIRSGPRRGYLQIVIAAACRRSAVAGYRFLFGQACLAISVQGLNVAPLFRAADFSLSSIRPNWGSPNVKSNASRKGGSSTCPSQIRLTATGLTPTPPVRQQYLKELLDESQH